MKRLVEGGLVKTFGLDRGQRRSVAPSTSNILENIMDKLSWSVTRDHWISPNKAYESSQWRG